MVLITAPSPAGSSIRLRRLLGPAIRRATMIIIGWLRMLARAAGRAGRWFIIEPARIRAAVLIIVLSGGLGAGAGLGLGYLVSTLAGMLLGLFDFH